jgi:hypothetical protein
MYLAIVTKARANGMLRKPANHRLTRNVD